MYDISPWHVKLRFPHLLALKHDFGRGASIMGVWEELLNDSKPFSAHRLYLSFHSVVHRDFISNLTDIVNFSFPCAIKLRRGFY